MKRLFSLVASSALLFIVGCQNPNTMFVPAETNTQVTQQTVDKSKYGTFKNDLWMAQSEARRWDMSAQLVKAESDFVSESGVSRWTFYFKSPFKRTVLEVFSYGSSQEVQDSFFGMDIYEFDVRVDSNQAIQIAKQQGLKSFPVSRMTLENRFGLEWTLESYNGRFRVDARNGKALTTTK